MSLKRNLQNIFVRTITSDRTRDRRRSLARLRGKISGKARCVEYFHQVDDPYSHLACQVLGEFLRRYTVELKIHLVDAPSDNAAADRDRLIPYARMDAAAIAPALGLSFTDLGEQPSPENHRRASEILAANLAPGRFSEIAPRVGAALWADDSDEILNLANEFATASEEEMLADRKAGTRRRQKLGHYNGATFYFEGEWYWGVDRLHYLEERLRDEGLRSESDAGPIIPPREISGESIEAPDASIVLEYFPSLRSPYSAISTERTYALAQQLPVKLVLKPVLPMVMRGLPVPLSKQLYIMRDTKREATRQGLPFGDIFDPVGEPVERAFSLYPFAKSQGRAAEYLASFMTNSFARGVDTGTNEGLRQVVIEAGLSWEEALPHLSHPGWEKELEANREEMLAAGIWGVPSYRIRSEGEPDFAIWGQDRLWLVEEEIRRRLQRPRSD
ncbi:MAG: DsbA family protein [Candidatus Binatia bacterium]|nr:DsbA family protein [Candidatus Binatia bacterium]MDG1959701.1 DsbA family protein [Candidatus Binatia bacterium]MDG2010238.1 DsbA family protein [Candidatus Binatia bacterium]